jgi:hypothetical protein
LYFFGALSELRAIWKAVTMSRTFSGATTACVFQRLVSEPNHNLPSAYTGMTDQAVQE